MHNSKLKKITVALCMALAPIAVFSAGLGKLNVSSGLGEPLRADIELLSVTPEELSSIFAAIASEEAYANQGIERPASHSTIKVEVSKNANGTPILKLKSTQPISEPFLDMLIQVDWASGRLLREYTVLLDPPGYTGESDVNAQSNQTTQLPTVKPTSSQEQELPADSSASSKKPSRTSKASQSKSADVTQDANQTEVTAETYVTQRGDSLAKIARDMQVEGVSLDQMLVAIYQANPSAFDGKNMNRLKVGKIIRPPSEQDLAGLSRQQASKEVKIQSANWNEYRNKLAGIVAESAPSESEAGSQSADGKIKNAAEDKSMSTSVGSKDVVKLSAGEAPLTKKESEDIKGLQAKITALQEESTAREKTVKEAQDKTAALEKQIADMQQLLALKNSTMSDMQKQAEMQASADKSNVPEPQSAPPVVAEEQKPAEIIPAQPAVAEQAVPPAAELTPQEKPKPAPVVVTEPAAEPSLLDGLDLPLLGAGAGLLALLGGGWMFLRNKRKRNLADFEQGIMTSGGLKANTVFGNTSGSSVDTGDTSFLTDFSQSANGGMIDTNDVDPIAEAEVYMAYGRDAQAEEILKDAISKEPKRYELHLKLLEMYAASKNVSAFETIAGELYTTLGGEDSTWIKVAEIGYKLEPSNPLYQANTAHSAGNSSGEKLDANDFSDSPIASATDLDFSFDNDSLAQNFASSANEKDAFDLDLDALNTGAENLSNDVTGDVEFSMGTPDTESLVANTIENLKQPDQVQAEHAVASAPEMMPPVSKSDDGLNFDFGELTTAAEVDSEHDGANFGHTMPGLDMSGFETPKSAPEVEDSFSTLNVDEAEIMATSSVADSEMAESFEMPMLEEMPLDELTTEVSFDTAEDTDMDSDFNFDLSTVSPEASSYVEEEVSTANTYDLSSISLDMPDAGMQDDSSLLGAADEPIEIETKLDLVAAYIEMDDAEGAKELLDEVMKEGGASQRKRAEVLLAKLG